MTRRHSSGVDVGDGRRPTDAGHVGQDVESAVGVHGVGHGRRARRGVGHVAVGHLRRSRRGRRCRPAPRWRRPRPGGRRRPHRSRSLRPTPAPPVPRTDPCPKRTRSGRHRYCCPPWEHWRGRSPWSPARPWGSAVRRRRSSPARGRPWWWPTWTRPAVTETVDLVEEAGGRAGFVRTDVSVPSDVEAMVAFAVDTFGGLDCAHNNAGRRRTHGPARRLPGRRLGPDARRHARPASTTA